MKSKPSKLPKEFVELWHELSLRCLILDEAKNHGIRLVKDTSADVAETKKKWKRLRQFIKTKVSYGRLRTQMIKYADGLK